MKAKDLIAILQQNPEAEILTTSDDSWSYQGVSIATFCEAGSNMDGCDVSGVDEISDDLVALVPVFVLQ